MGKLIKMIAVLLLISAVSGLALGSVNLLTAKGIEENILKYKKLPAILAICEGAIEGLDNAAKVELEKQIIQNRIELEVKTGEGENKQTITIFRIDRGGKPYSAVLEGSAQGYGGEVGVMAGFELDHDELSGVGVTVHSETPGLGSRITGADFLTQFRTLPFDESEIKVKKDGGNIDSISGATVSSRAVANGINQAKRIYLLNKEEIQKAIKEQGK